jgi:hypothetical protein
VTERIISDVERIISASRLPLVTAANLQALYGRPRFFTGAILYNRIIYNGGLKGFILSPKVSSIHAAGEKITRATKWSTSYKQCTSNLKIQLHDFFYIIQ